MKTTYYRTVVQSSLFWVRALLVMPFILRPIAAESRANTPEVAKVDTFVSEQVQRHGVPGLALALVDGDQISHPGGYRHGRDRPVTPQTPFVLASASKPITVLAIMQLVEDGKLELDAPTQRYLPKSNARPRPSSATTSGPPPATNNLTSSSASRPT